MASKQMFTRAQIDIALAARAAQQATRAGGKS